MIEPAYVELRCRSAFSFLDGASLPEDLIGRAAELGCHALALADRDGLYGAPRFFAAAAKAAEKAAPERAPSGSQRRDEALLDAWVSGWPVRPIFGAVLTLAGEASSSSPEAAPQSRPELLVLVENREGYRNLSRLITRSRQVSGGGRHGAAADRGGKVEPAIPWPLLREHARGLIALVGGGGGVDPVGRALCPRTRQSGKAALTLARAALDELRAIFSDDNLYLEVERHYDPDEEIRNQRVLALARHTGLPVVATNDVRYATPDDHRLHDVLVCTRHHATVDEIGRRLPSNAERHLKSPSQMAALFADLPGAVRRTAEVAARCQFTLANLGYKFPTYPVSDGETEQSRLEALTWERAATRFRPLHEAARAQLARELALIARLRLAGYFLIVWDIVEFCRANDILVQGRGSAANSAVCYALGITAVDPVRMKLLFERFLSEERGEWPDIDLDLPSGEKREQAIQYVFAKYGPRGVAMTANVITYRPKMAVRDVGRALGFAEEQLATLSRHLTRFEFIDSSYSILNQIAEAGFSVEEERVKLLADLSRRLLNLPRHLGQHSGGMVIAAGNLDEIVPLEPASMPNRVVVEWDKDDCADLGIVKVDLLGLGMMAVLKDTVDLARQHEGVHVDLAHLPHEGPEADEVYDMLCAADTVGVFQVESRAQMATLPRMQPRQFYDLVIEVAIIRPGPIVGDMLHPFLRRRAGRELPDPLHPSLAEVLDRTLGVPLFQEQLMRMAMVAAGFTGGQAEELRRAMGFKRSTERMRVVEAELRAGMDRNGIDAAAQEKIVKSITSFALYGFPESHAASFALIAYASCWLKVWHPAAFFAALLNNWPMGFYHPASLVRDALRWGVEVRPVDVTVSNWLCTLEPAGPAIENEDEMIKREYIAEASNRLGGYKRGHLGPALRVGLRYVRGLGEEVGRRIEAARAERDLASPSDLAARASVPRAVMTALAEGGALGGFGAGRREALWQVEAIGRSGALFEHVQDGDIQGGHVEGDHVLAEMSEAERLEADYRVAGLSVGRHPMALYRDELRRSGTVTADDLVRLPAGRRVRVAGQLIVRQRPGSAKGFFFFTLEDETGLANGIVTPSMFLANRPLLVSAAALLVEGVLQRLDGTVSVKADRFFPLSTIVVPSRDFH